MDTQSEFNSVGLFDGRYRSFLETMNELRPSLHRYCARMTGSVMDGEDIAHWLFCSDEVIARNRGDGCPAGARQLRRASQKEGVGQAQDAQEKSASL